MRACVCVCVCVGMEQHQELAHRLDLSLSKVGAKTRLC